HFLINIFLGTKKFAEKMRFHVGLLFTLFLITNINAVGTVYGFGLGTVAYPLPFRFAYPFSLRLGLASPFAYRLSYPLYFRTPVVATTVPVQETVVQTQKAEKATPTYVTSETTTTQTTAVP